MNIKEKLLNLPHKPGSYQMKDADGQIIYVGKAKDLFNRVNSYFRGAHDAKTTKMVSMIDDFEYIVTSTETEAFILEINLIKKYNPKYNILLTDDKTYPCICLTNETHPRIYYTRDISKKKGKYYGPYPDSKSAKEVVELLNKVYPLRKCNVIPKKECLYYHLHQCLGPCIHQISSDEYKNITTKIQSFLRGNVKEEIREITEKMNEASNNLEFEKAIEYRNILESLKVISEKQKMEVDMLDSDVINYYVQNSKISIQVFHIRNGKMIERNGNLFDCNDNEEEIFKEFIMQFYLINNNPIPKEIIVPKMDYSVIDQVILEKIFIPKQGKKFELLNLVGENAKEKIDVLEKTSEVKYSRTLGAVIELSKLLGLDVCHVIEAFDNSNIQGSSAVSAMVSYLDGVPNKKMYRKYKVKTVVGADDFKTMEEVVTRRYTRLKQEKLKMPDLVIIDGGKPQVQSALKALERINCKLNVLGLVKDDNHHTDALYFNSQIIRIDKRSNLFLFLESLQDEVHRYAITFHRTLHSKNTLSSKLDSIKGVGKVKKQKILSLVGTLNFTKENLKKLHMNEEQIEEVLKIFR